MSTTEREGSDTAVRPSFDHVFDMLCSVVQRRPDASAVTWRNRTYNYREFGRCVAGFIARIEAEAVAGERIAVLLPNCPEFTFSVYASMAAGAQVAMLNPRLTDAELRPLLDDLDPALTVTMTSTKNRLDRFGSGCRTICVDEDISLESWCDGVGELTRRNLDPDSLAYLLYTGGTTGAPKGVNHTHRDLMLTVEGMEDCWPTRDDIEVWLGVAPMFHSWGFLTGCICPVYGAAHSVIQDGYQPEGVLSDLDRHRVTVFGGGPAPIYTGLLEAGNFSEVDLSRLRVCPSGGAPLPDSVARTWFERTGVRITPGYGMTEVSPITCCRPEGAHPPGSVGIARKYIELAVSSPEDGSLLPAGERGEILVRAPHAMVSYRNNPQETAATVVDGWIRTGDIGYLDDRGYLFLVDRKKDLIIVNGFNVYPGEINAALCRHRQIRAAATIGVDHSRTGETPVSFVVPSTPGWSNDQEILKFLRTVMAGYKMPTEILFIKALPATPARKTDLIALRKQYELGRLA